MVRDYYAELEMLQNTVDFTVSYFKALAGKSKKEANERRAAWVRQRPKVCLSKSDVDLCLMIATPNPDLGDLPVGSWFLQFTFALYKPYISKDDDPFYIIDNPIVRDKVFQLPLVRPSNWKGSLCDALWQLGYERQGNSQMQRLFGVGPDDGTGRAGRLFFYPTFFTETGLEVVNPHDRVRRIGKNPILFECVPCDSKGTFSLLYVPFDLIEESEDKIKKQASEDLILVSEGLVAMFLTYGFSAKRSSGYGIAKDEILAGKFKTKLHTVDLCGVSLSRLTEKVKNVSF